jgi:hypothetical protein
VHDIATAARWSLTVATVVVATSCTAAPPDMRPHNRPAYGFVLKPSRNVAF